MKKGISLIVLVITIIVMIILAAAIIISISNSNIINKANKAVADTNIATIKEAAALKFADVTLAIKEAGNESILGGKTVGQYIEQELINDGTMKESDAVIFTPKGGVYGPTEYNSIPDKDETRDWRYINGKLYYVGTDIAKRKALKENPNVNTDYMYIYSDMMDRESGVLVSRLSNIGLLGQVSSFAKLINDESLSNNLNDGINSSSVGLTDNVALATAMELTLKETYNGQPIKVKILMYGDVMVDGKSIDQGMDVSTTSLIIDEFVYPGMHYGYPLTDYYNDSVQNGITNLSEDEFIFIIKSVIDGDLNNKFDYQDIWIMSFISDEVSYFGEPYANDNFFNDDGIKLSVSEMWPYKIFAARQDITNQINNFNNSIDIYKKVRGLPGDIAK